MYRILANLGLVALIASALFASDAFAGEKGKLQIWINGDKAYNGLAEVGKRFTKDTGIEVVVEHPQDAPSKFQQAAAAGKGPDVFFWAHDRFGEWATAGLLEPVTPSAKVRRQIEKIGWDAFTMDGRLYGYPIAIEAVALIYNKALVKTPPKNFDQVMALDKKLKKDGKSAILWAYNNTFFTWPLLAANGGYVFKRQKNGNYNVSDIGVNNAGALKGVETILQLIESGVMPVGADYAAMESAMNKGEIAMMISGPWAWPNLRKNNIDFGIAPIPAVGNKPSKPFIGVLGAMINRASPNKDLAKEFIENYVLTNAGLKSMDDDVTLGVPAHKGFYRVRSKDPLVRGTMRSIKGGMLMPATPEMGRFWSAMESALQNITNGRQKPKEALDSAAKRIKG